MVRGLVAGAAVAGLLLTSGVAAGATGEWSEEQVPSNGKWSSLDTVAAGDGEVWAFGKWMDAKDVFHSKAFRRGAEGWEEVKVPDLGRLNGSHVVSSRDVWAVGDGASMHWDGKAWTEVPIDAPGDTYTQLFGTTSFGSDDVWAAGFMPAKNNTKARGTMQHWDGKAWTDVPVPDVGKFWALSGVDGVATDDVWAVGSLYSDSGKAVALHWNGESWSDVPVPTVEAASYVSLKDVEALAPDDVWAVGEKMLPNGEPKPYAVHWDGKAWTIAETPEDPASTMSLSRVGDGLVAVGYASDAASPFAMRYDGKSWKRMPSPAGEVTFSGSTELPGGELLVVGAQGPEVKRQEFASVHAG